MHGWCRPRVAGTTTLGGRLQYQSGHALFTKPFGGGRPPGRGGMAAYLTERHTPAQRYGRDFGAVRARAASAAVHPRQGNSVWHCGGRGPDLKPRRVRRTRSRCARMKGKSGWRWSPICRSRVLSSACFGFRESPSMRLRCTPLRPAARGPPARGRPLPRFQISCERIRPLFFSRWREARGLHRGGGMQMADRSRRYVQPRPGTSLRIGLRLECGTRRSRRRGNAPPHCWTCAARTDRVSKSRASATTFGGYGNLPGGKPSSDEPRRIQRAVCVPCTLWMGPACLRSVVSPAEPLFLSFFGILRG